MQGSKAEASGHEAFPLMAYMTLSKFLIFPGFGFAICKMEISPLQDERAQHVSSAQPAVVGTGGLALWLLSCH